MTTHNGYMVKVDLEGPNGDALVDIRCQVTVAEARRLAIWMTRGDELRVSFPEPTPKTAHEPRVAPNSSNTGGEHG